MPDHAWETPYLRARNRFHLGPGAILIMWAMPPWYGSTPDRKAAPSVLLAGFGLYQLNRVFDLVEDQVNDPAAYARTAAVRNMLRGVAFSALLASLGLSIVLMNYVATALLAIVLPRLELDRIMAGWTVRHNDFFTERTRAICTRLRS